MRIIGKVKWFNNGKGYGFIECDAGSDVFIHFSPIQGEGFRTLEDGQVVEFEIVDDPKGPRHKLATSQKQASTPAITPGSRSGSPVHVPLTDQLAPFA